MDLANLITKHTVKVPLEAYDKEEAIAELVEVLVRAGKLTNRDAVVDALYEREAKGTTGIGGGVAIPHAKCPQVEGVVLAVGVSPDGVEFDAADGELVNVVFLVVAETHNPGPNVEVLAEIGSLMQVPGLVGSLSEARDVDTFLAALNRAWEEA